MSHTIWINGRITGADTIFAQNLRYLLENVNSSNNPLAFACIGSSRVTGDNLGPIIGTILTRSHYPHVYGTLEHPLNALTLPDCMPMLRDIEQRYCLIAIDAAIGNVGQCGHLTLSSTCLHPGSALRRQLPPLGHIHITGVFDSLETRKTRQLLPVLCRHIGLGLLEICREI